MKKATVWMAVTADRLELPIAVADSSEELASELGIKATSIHEKMCRDKKRGEHHGRNTEYWIRKVEL